jgi:GntR family transcriptional regulator
VVPVAKRDGGMTKLGVATGEPFARLLERHYSSDGRPIAYSVIDVDDRYIRFEVFRRR